MDTAVNNTIDWNQEYNYVLQWLFESRNARWEYQRMLYRVDKAMEGLPSRNLYQEELTSNLKRLSPQEQQDAKNSGCTEVKVGRSDIIKKSVQNRANQMASGVDTYQYEIHDKYGIIEPDTADLLAARSSMDYVENRLEELSATFSRDLSKYGIAAVIVKYDQCHEKNIVERINPKNIWFDTMYSSTNSERFRGYSMMISWDKLKKMIEADGDDINTKLEVPDRSVLNKNGEPDKHIKVGKKKIRTLNDLDIYVGDMNKLAASPSIQAPITEYWEYDHDLRSCYNLNWYQTFATEPKAKTESGYNGQDVELTIMYDLSRKIEYKIINRRFIISANKKAFTRKIAFTIYNPITGDKKVRIDDYYLDCPLKFQYEEWEERDKLQFPTSPVMGYLDEFDELCGWRARRDHVSKLLSVLRIETNGADASALKKTLNIMGVILDDIQGDINSINFQYDYNPIDSQIEYLERTIKDGLAAYDQFDALQAMGDRASAAEAGQANGAIAQGLSTHQNAIMRLYADIARQCNGNRVVYSAESEFPVTNLSDSSSISIQQMALDAVVTVKPKLAKKIAERTIAANAMTLLGSMKEQLTPDLTAILMEQALFGQVPRKAIASLLKPQGASAQEIANAQLQAQNQAQMLQQNQAAYEQNPIPYEVENAQQTMSPDEIDQVIAGLGETEEEITPEGIEMQNQEGAMDIPGLEGMTPEMGSQFANPNGYYG